MSERDKGIIFDLDGTLWEVTDRTYESVNEVTKKYNLEEVSRETVCNTFGMNREESAKNYFPYLNLDKALKLIDEIAIINIKNLKQYGGNLYSNLESTLIKLKRKYKLFIVSNTGETEYIEAFIISSNLSEYFDSYIAASALKISKADGIKKVINENGLKKAIYVGDTRKDLDSSNIANIPFVHARYGFDKNLKTEFFINSIQELPDIAEKIFNK